MTDNPLRDTFAYYRARGLTARNALAKAREYLATGKRRYGASNPAILFNPPHSSHGDKHVRWIENAAAGLRLTGYADEICRSIDHTGWYTDDEGFLETLRGIVYQLPSRKGELRFAYGYADPNNAGAALLCFDPCDDKEDAARWADRFAQIHAEEERDYQRAWQAGRYYDDLAEEISTTRKACLELIREAKAGCKSLTNLPAIKATIRDRIESYVDTIREAREKRAELFDAEGHHPGFKDT